VHAGPEAPHAPFATDLAMSGLLSLLLLLLAPPVLGLAFGLIQWGIYRALVRAGRVARERVPFFPILWLRGMIVVVAIGAIFAIVQTISSS
jgi:hypothetical protein